MPRLIVLLTLLAAVGAASAGCGAELIALDERPRSPATATPPTQRDCRFTREVVEIGISATRYPRVLAHIEAAVRDGWPRVLRIRRDGADERRDRLMRGIRTKPGFDRDEWPMAMARAHWRAHVAYVPSGENRGAGASIGTKLRRWCDGVRFRVVGY